MTALTLAARDSTTMLRRNLIHAVRYPAVAGSVLVTPVVLLLLFTYVYGNALGTSVDGASVSGSGGPGSSAGSGGSGYIDYIAPGIILMATTSGALAAAVSVCVDMTEGIVNRFRTMAISRAAFLTGHVVGGVVQTMTAAVVVVAVALGMGFRPNATPLEWLAATGLLTLLTVALTWLAAGIGLVAKTPEAASNAPMPLMFLPLLGSAVVPPETMPAGLRWFAEYQPFTPVIETLRGLLMGTDIGGSGPVALAWCTGMALTGYLWARTVFHRGATTR